MKKNLTHQNVRSAGPGEYYDTNDRGRGLILRVLKSGRRRFEFRYRFGGKNKRFEIGKFPDISLKEARDKLPGLKQQVNEGSDPQAERERKRKQEEQLQREEEAEKTFRELVNRYKHATFDKLRPVTRNEYQRIIDQELLPKLGDTPVADINTKQITELLDRKATDQGSPVMANRIRARLHTIFDYAEGRFIPNGENPVSDTDKYEESTGERYYSKSELRKLWEYFLALSEPVQSYMKIITLTGQRRTETLNMRWDNIHKMDDKDFKGWVWLIPAKLAKSDRAHEVQLSPMALNIIRGLKQRAGKNPYVFASHHGNEEPVSLSTVKRAVRDIKDDCISDFRLHDMRRTFSSHLAAMGISQEVTEKILNHKSSGSGGQLAKIYNLYDYRPERQRALNQWALRLGQILEEKPAKIHDIA